MNKLTRSQRRWLGTLAAGAAVPGLLWYLAIPKTIELSPELGVKLLLQGCRSQSLFQVQCSQGELRHSLVSAEPIARLSKVQLIPEVLPLLWGGRLDLSVMSEISLGSDMAEPRGMMSLTLNPRLQLLLAWARGKKPAASLWHGLSLDLSFKGLSLAVLSKLPKQALTWRGELAGSGSISWNGQGAASGSVRLQSDAIHLGAREHSAEITLRAPTGQLRFAAGMPGATLSVSGSARELTLVAILMGCPRRVPLRWHISGLTEPWQCLKP